MIELKYRPWDWEEWTYLTLEGPAAEDAANVFSGWAMSQDMEIERFDGEDWIPVGEEE